MISDASPLIFLAKINRMDLLHKMFKKVIIPTAVRDEVLQKGTDALAIRKAIENKQINVQEPKKQLDLHLGKGETAAISLAKEIGDGLIIDDARAYNIARALGIDVQRTTSVIFHAVKKNILTREEAAQLIHKLVQSGYYITPAVYADIVERLK